MNSKSSATPVLTPAVAPLLLRRKREAGDLPIEWDRQGPRPDILLPVQATEVVE